MPNYVRVFRPGGTFFLTLVTERRAPLFAENHARTLLHDAIARCQSFHPFEIDAIILLPDHLHLLMTLPRGDADFSVRLRLLKSRFTRTYLASGGTEQRRSDSRVRQQARGVWQRRFWEHTIRDEDDLHRHSDYVHYNAVKHKQVTCPHLWPHSSFHRFVAEKRYEPRWCCCCDGRPAPSKMDWDDIAQAAGE